MKLSPRHQRSVTVGFSREHADDRLLLTLHDVDQHIGNEGGYLQCGQTLATLDCLYPWTPEGQTELKS